MSYRRINPTVARKRYKTPDHHIKRKQLNLQMPKCLKS